jgi:hypothetical protein
MRKADTEGCKSLQLLARITQLAHLAKQQGLDIKDDFPEVYNQWDREEKIGEMNPLFAINTLRTLKSHSIGKTEQEIFEKNCAALGIDLQSTNSGWGYAMDLVYEKLAASFAGIASLIRAAQQL